MQRRTVLVLGPLACLVHACAPGAMMPDPPAPPASAACSAFAADCATDQGPQAPVDLVAADLDGDGVLDLAVANEDSNDISIALGLGDGTFMPTINVPVVEGTRGPQVITAGDMDADGDMDLVVLLDLFDETAVRLLLNNGNATFANPIGICCDGLSASNVAVADFDGNGELDLVVGGLNANDPPQLILRLNTGGLTFSPEIPLDGPELFGGTHTLAVADYNGDGLADIAAMNSFDDESIHVLLNSGGDFLTPTVLAVPEDPLAVTAADVDGDGDADIALASGFFEQAVTLYRNDGAGAFDMLASFATQAPATSIAAADFDGDGDTDLAVASDTLRPTDNVCVLLNRGNGSFATPARTFQVGGGPHGLTAADLDDDGDIDLATANLRANDGSILLNDGNADFTLVR